MKVFIVMLIIAFSMAVPCYAADPPKGFLGMNFGESTSACKKKAMCGDDVPQLNDSDTSRGYSHQKKEVMLGDIKLISVNYYFQNDRLWLISAMADEKDYGHLRRQLEWKYGKATYGGNSFKTWMWVTKTRGNECQWTIELKGNRITYLGYNHSCTNWDNRQDIKDKL